MSPDLQIAGLILAVVSPVLTGIGLLRTLRTASNDQQRMHNENQQAIGRAELVREQMLKSLKHQDECLDDVKERLTAAETQLGIIARWWEHRTERRADRPAALPG